MTVTEITSYEKFKELIAQDKPVLIDFWATWCGPCKTISPILEGHSEKEENSAIQFYKVDIDEQSQIAEEVGIRAMPTFIVFKNGNKFDTLVGANPGKLETLITNAKSAE